MKLYGLKNCDTCRKALKWLVGRGVPVEFVDVREGKISRSDIERFITRAGWEKALNRKSTTWRELSDDEKSDIGAAKAITLIAAHPTLLKRPVIEVGDETLIGFDDSVRARMAELWKRSSVLKS